MMKRSKRNPTDRILRLVVIGVPLAAWGQTPGSFPNESGLAEITVTAQRRNQNIQDVPIDMVALSGEMLQDRSVTGIVGTSRRDPSFDSVDMHSAGRRKRLIHFIVHCRCRT
jgi:iron complex outermembrane receptor protein